LPQGGEGRGREEEGGSSSFALGRKRKVVDREYRLIVRRIKTESSEALEM